MPVVVKGNSVVEKATGRVLKTYRGAGAAAKAKAYAAARNIAYAKKRGHRIPKRGGKGKR